MKRFPLLLAAAVAAILLIARPALAVNLHNGAIVVRNNTHDEINIFLEHAWYTGHPIERAKIPPGHTFVTDACCFAAGSPYQLRVYRRAGAPMGGNLHDFLFHPHLCNSKGIPYGYAVLVVEDNNTIREVDQRTCFENLH